MDVHEATRLCDLLAETGIPAWPRTYHFDLEFRAEDGHRCWDGVIAQFVQPDEHEAEMQRLMVSLALGNRFPSAKEVAEASAALEKWKAAVAAWEGLK